jgi:hypothetical protein
VPPRPHGPTSSRFHRLELSSTTHPVIASPTTTHPHPPFSALFAPPIEAFPLAMALAISSLPSAPGRANGFFSIRPSLVICILQLLTPLVKALPVVQRAVQVFGDEDLPKDPNDASLWVYLGTAMALVVGGGAFAGLTIA